MKLQLFFLVLLLPLVILQTTIVEECGKHANIEVEETLLDAPIKELVWGNSVVVYALTIKNTVYMSTNEGKNWENISSKLEDSGIVQVLGQSGVRKVVVTKDPNKALFLGWGRQYWIGNNGQFSLHSTINVLMDLQAHPTEPDWFIALSRANACINEPNTAACTQNLFVTTNFGEHFDWRQSYVFHASWGNEKESIFFTSVTSRSIPQFSNSLTALNFYRSDDLGVSIAHSVNHITDFLYHNDWLYLAEYLSSGTLQLYASSDGGKTKTLMQFPDTVQNRYTILDNSEGSAFVNVQGPARQYGSLYSSDSTDSLYTLSLARNKRLVSGETDFQRLMGIDGIYVANAYRAEAVEDPANREAWLQSFISFDIGGEWKPITPPADEACEDCRLHLFGKAQIQEGSRLLSRSSAIGLIIGNGNVGKFQQSREDLVNTYVSNDAGLSWNRVRKGLHVYEFGDHGALMLMASAEDVTSRIIYSWDEGKSWKECDFTNKSLEIDVTKIEVEPAAKSQKFIVYGSRMTSNKIEIGVVVHLDFTGLHERQCKGSEVPGTEDSDYAIWYPSDETKTGCILGQKTGYVRRKPHKQCYNGQDFSRNSTVMACACTREDYECDGVCYRVNSEGKCENQCVGSENDPEQPPFICDGYWHKSKGYRFVPGTQCDVTKIGAVDLRPQKMACPATTSVHEPSPMTVVVTKPQTPSPTTVVVEAPSPKLVPVSVITNPTKQAPSPNTVHYVHPPEPSVPTTPSKGTTTPSTSGGMGLGGVLVLLLLCLLFIVAISLAALVILYRTNDKFRDAMSDYVPDFSSKEDGYSLVGNNDGGGFGGLDLLDEEEEGIGNFDSAPAQKITSLPPISGFDDDEAPMLELPK